MPVYRYRSFEEAQRALWRFETDTEYYRMLAELFRLGQRLAPSELHIRPVGVFRYRSLEEAEKKDSRHYFPSYNEQR